MKSTKSITLKLKNRKFNAQVLKKSKTQNINIEKSKNKNTKTLKR
jgi:hypothetical protein